MIDIKKTVCCSPGRMATLLINSFCKTNPCVINVEDRQRFSGKSKFIRSFCSSHISRPCTARKLQLQVLSDELISLFYVQPLLIFIFHRYSLKTCLEFSRLRFTYYLRQQHADISQSTDSQCFPFTVANADNEINY